MIFVDRLLCLSIFLGGIMEERLAVLGILVENAESVQAVNDLLHEFGQYIRGRLGIPRVKGQVSAISIIIIATNNQISTLTGKLGMLPGVSAKAVYSKL